MKPIKFSWLFFALALAASIILTWLGGVNHIAADNPNHTDNDGIFQAYCYALQTGNLFVVAGLLIAFVLAIWVILALATGGFENKSLNDKAPLVLLLVLSSLALACQRTPQLTQALSPTEAELFPAPRLMTDAAGWTVVDTSQPATR